MLKLHASDMFNCTQYSHTLTWRFADKRWTQPASRSASPLDHFNPVVKHVGLLPILVIRNSQPDYQITTLPDGLQAGQTSIDSLHPSMILIFINKHRTNSWCR
jgi:hypothetical protein